MTDLWNKDPAKWRAMTLEARLEAMRKWHCTGPCGQCASTMNTQNTLNQTLREAMDVIAELQIYKAAMESMASQFIHPKITAMEMAKSQLEIKNDE